MITLAVRICLFIYLFGQWVEALPRSGVESSSSNLLRSFIAVPGLRCCSAAVLLGLSSSTAARSHPDTAFVVVL